MRCALLSSNWRNSLLCETTRGPLGTDVQRAYEYPRFDLVNILNLQEILAYNGTKYDDYVVIRSAYISTRSAYIGTSCNNRNVNDVYNVTKVIEYGAASSLCKEDNLLKMQEVIWIRK